MTIRVPRTSDGWQLQCYSEDERAYDFSRDGERLA